MWQPPDLGQPFRIWVPVLKGRQVGGKMLAATVMAPRGIQMTWSYLHSFLMLKLARLIKSEGKHACRLVEDYVPTLAGQVWPDTPPDAMAELICEAPEAGLLLGNVDYSRNPRKFDDVDAEFLEICRELELQTLVEVLVEMG